MLRRRLITAVAAVVCLGAALSVTALVTAGSAAAAPRVPNTDSPFYWFTPGQELSAQGRTVLEGTTLAQGPRHVAATSTGFRLILQSDGNLVEYLARPGTTSQAVWATATSTATRLVFQGDHNVVLRDAAGHALWATGTAGTAASYFSVYGNGQLVTQDASGRLWSATGPSLTASPGVLVAAAHAPLGEFWLSVQSDGNLVEYRQTGGGPAPVWWSGTAGAGAVRLAAQADGDLVLRQAATGRVVWSAGSHGPTTYYQLDVQDDANVVLYRTDGVHRLNAVWATYTRA